MSCLLVLPLHLPRKQTNKHLILDQSTHLLSLFLCWAVENWKKSAIIIGITPDTTSLTSSTTPMWPDGCILGLETGSSSQVERGFCKEGILKWLTLRCQKEGMIALIGYKISPQMNPQSTVWLTDYLGHTTILDWSQSTHSGFFFLYLFSWKWGTSVSIQYNHLEFLHIFE